MSLNGNHRIEVELQPANLPEVELRLHAGRLYVDEKRGVAEIATLLGLSRMRVYNLLNALSLTPRLMLDLQLNDVLENSVNTLAALSERMRDDATTRGGDVKERETDAKVYATLFDRTMPLMDAYMKHRPAFLKAGELLPPSQAVPSSDQGDSKSGDPSQAGSSESAEGSPSA
jgi:hypothetical protein